MNTVDRIISDMQTYKEDNPHIIITPDMIRELIIDYYLDDIIKEIEEEL